MMKALSLSRPWAWLCAVGLKDIENRPWALPANFELPQRYIFMQPRALITALPR
jgi:hypothetical protein